MYTVCLDNQEMRFLTVLLQMLVSNLSIEHDLEFSFGNDFGLSPNDLDSFYGILRAANQAKIKIDNDKTHKESYSGLCVS